MSEIPPSQLGVNLVLFACLPESSLAAEGLRLIPLPLGECEVGVSQQTAGLLHLILHANHWPHERHFNSSLQLVHSHRPHLCWLCVSNRETETERMKTTEYYVCCPWGFLWVKKMKRIPLQMDNGC